MKFVNIVAGLMALGFVVMGQAAPVTVLNEGFEDFSGLSAAGWMLTNNSTPAGQSWFAGNSGVFPAQAGSADSYAAVNFLSTTADAGAIDNWLISPEFALGTASTTLDFFTQGADNGFFDLLEVRFGNGSSSNVANFTSLLATIGDGTSASYPVGGWTQFTLTLPTAVTGRVAFRYLAADAGNADYIGVDTVTVTAMAASTDVPEPGTFALAGLALVATAFTRRRLSASSTPCLV
jgi:hypothetical protein